MNPAHRTITPGRAIRARAAGRAAIGGLLALTVLVIALTLGVDTSAPAPQAWLQVTVEPRSTLWDLAQRHPVQGLSTAETVSLIRERNGLDTAVIFAGQIIHVPETATSGVSVALR